MTPLTAASYISHESSRRNKHDPPTIIYRALKLSAYTYLYVRTSIMCVRTSIPIIDERPEYADTFGQNYIFTSKMSEKSTFF